MREFYGNTFIDLDKQEREAINLPFLFRTPEKFNNIFYE